MVASQSASVVGTVGVPARYGGFETLAEQLCTHFPPDRFRLTIYCEKGAYSSGERSEAFGGHSRVFLPLRANGLASLFYDAFALLHAAFVAKAQRILILGYSGAWILPFLRIAKPNVHYVVNVDGMEWRREKFSRPARLLLKALEFLAARFGSAIIADNEALAEIFEARYHRVPVTIAYGGDHTVVTPEAPQVPSTPYGHYLAIARIEPENNTRTILQACRDVGVPVVFIGNWNASDYGKSLREEFANIEGILLLDPIYDQNELDRWRRTAKGYIHGHSVGGTNPSLVEALFHTAALVSFDCPFNRATLSNAGSYFFDARSLATILAGGPEPIGPDALEGLRNRYRWRQIAAQYINVLFGAEAIKHNSDRPENN